MPIPVPTPTPLQVVTVAEIMMVSSDDARSLIASDSDQDISDAKWGQTLSDISSWSSVIQNPDNIKKVDVIEFFEGTVETQRLNLRNRVRLRYGLRYLSSEESSALACEVSSLRWF